MRSAILFSKPSRRSLEKGRLFGSEAMWRVRASSEKACGAINGIATSSALKIRLLTSAATRLERKHIQRASFAGVLGEIFHRADEAESGSWVSWVEVAGDDRAGPTA